MTRSTSGKTAAVTMNRRSFALLLGAGAVGATAAFALTREARKTVILGGGPAGATAAVELARAGHGPVTLIERDPHRLIRNASALPATAAVFAKPQGGPDLDALRAAGVEVMIDEATSVDWKSGRLDLFSGRKEAFDRLVLAPGTATVEEHIPGLDARARHIWPAAWGGNVEARRLAAELAALPKGGSLVLRLPAVISQPEVARTRAATLAAVAVRHGARLTVLDGGEHADLAGQFRADTASLQSADLDWRPADQGGRVLSVNADEGWLETASGRIEAQVVNFLAPQSAGPVARAAGLTDAGGWCPCDDLGRSNLRDGVLILGDARASAHRTLQAASLSARAALSV